MQLLYTFYHALLTKCTFLYIMVTCLFIVITITDPLLTRTKQYVINAHVHVVHSYEII